MSVQIPCCINYLLNRGAYDFFMAELHGIWDFSATVPQRLSRASYLDYVLPQFDKYASSIGLVSTNRRYPGADLDYFSALN